MDVTTVSLSCAKFSKPLGSSYAPSPPISIARLSDFANNSAGFHCKKKSYLPAQLKIVEARNRKQKKYDGRLCASAAETDTKKAPAVVTGKRWFLEPVGDGDWRHIGYKVKLPGVYEIASDEVTVGRVPEKADIVIPVATVSGLHARIQKLEGSLLVTDLDSTNGTFINELRLKPGAPAAAAPGSRITFGDINLAIFQVSKIEYTMEATDQPEEAEV